MTSRRRVEELYDQHVARGRSLAPGSPPEELFIHFGHWDAPETAEPAQFQTAQRRLNDRLLALAGPLDDQLVVDVGCGLGGTLATIAEVTTHATLIGVNLDARQLTIARKHVRTDGNRVAWCVADACALPFGEATVDVLVAVECVPHFRSRERFLDEAARVLGDDGRLVISDFVAAGSPDAALVAVLDRGLGAWAGLAPDDYASLAAARSLTLEVCEDASRATWPSYACILGGDPLARELDSFTTDEEAALGALARLQSQQQMRIAYLAFRRQRRRATAV